LLFLQAYFMNPVFAPPLASSRVLSSYRQLDIGESLGAVDVMRSERRDSPALQQAVQSIKRTQVHRFRYSYAEVLVHSDWGQAAHFFLTELYSEHDYARRDAEFARIAPTIQRVFPKSVVEVATTLARLHALTEFLDQAMANAMLLLASPPISDSAALRFYPQAWLVVGQSAARFEQLALTQNLGISLTKLARTPGVRVMLRMMRAPAQAAGLLHLQDFLEKGFDVFGRLQRSKSGAGAFLELIAVRENAWIERLFNCTATNANGSHLWPELE
jgi:hypothetical protein